MAVVDSRASLVNALLGGRNPAIRASLSEFLSGLSRDEMQCIAEFEGACILEDTTAYRMLAPFFANGWPDAEARAHKTFVILTWLDLRKSRAAATLSFATS